MSAAPVTSPTIRHTLLSTAELSTALSVRDLSDPAQGPHALQLLVGAATEALGAAWSPVDVRTVRRHPLVPVTDNYEGLGCPPESTTRDARYTRYASETTMLRSQTTAMVPPALRALAAEQSQPQPRPLDAMLVLPGLVYRRDEVDRLHSGTPHQLDLWRISELPLPAGALDEMIDLVLTALLPNLPYRAIPSPHPYTTGGLQLDVRTDDHEWVEVGECGRAAPHVLARAGLPATANGLAMGLGLDRLLMLRTGIPDIRLLRAAHPQVAAQMRDLTPYCPISRHPAIRRDLSLAVTADADPETLGDEVRTALGPDADAVEAVTLLSETPVSELPPAAAERLGADPSQKNALLRLTLRHPTRTLSDAEANTLRDRVYAALHRGSRHQWATQPPAPSPTA